MSDPELGNGLAAQTTVTVADFARIFRRIQSEIHKAIVGHEQAIEELLSALFAGGHVLIEGVPGTGKTTLVKSLGQALNLSFNRVQFTVDLMPADITGTRVILSGADGRREFSFQPGPIFCHILLGDEINRATPKTQSALLEAMAERQVTAGGVTYPLAPPYFVMATLNPIEMEGTYPLPEAQLDRFLFKVRLGYPGEEELVRIISATTGAPESPVEPVFAAIEAAGAIEQLKRLVREVIVAPTIEHYAARMVRDAAGKLARAGRSAFADQGRRGDALRQFRLESARRAGADPGRQGARAARRARQYRLRGYRPGRARRPRASDHAQLRRPYRQRRRGADRRRSGQSGPGGPPLRAARAEVDLR